MQYVYFFPVSRILKLRILANFQSQSMDGAATDEAEESFVVALGAAIWNACHNGHLETVKMHLLKQIPYLENNLEVPSYSALDDVLILDEKFNAKEAPWAPQLLVYSYLNYLRMHFKSTHSMDSSSTTLPPQPPKKREEELLTLPKQQPVSWTPSDFPPLGAEMAKQTPPKDKRRIRTTLLSTSRISSPSEMAFTSSSFIPAAIETSRPRTASSSSTTTATTTTTMKQDVLLKLETRFTSSVVTKTEKDAPPPTTIAKAPLLSPKEGLPRSIPIPIVINKERNVKEGAIYEDENHNDDEDVEDMIETDDDDDTDVPLPPLTPTAQLYVFCLEKNLVPSSPDELQWLASLICSSSRNKNVSAADDNEEASSVSFAVSVLNVTPTWCEAFGVDILKPFLETLTLARVLKLKKRSIRTLQARIAGVIHAYEEVRAITSQHVGTPVPIEMASMSSFPKEYESLSSSS
jgi:hypothetical protein